MLFKTAPNACIQIFFYNKTSKTGQYNIFVESLEMAQSQNKLTV